MNVIDRNSQQFNELMNQLGKIGQRMEALTLDTLRKDWLHQDEVCEWLKVSASTLANYRNQGLIVFTRIMGKIYYQEKDVKQLLEDHHRSSF